MGNEAAQPLAGPFAIDPRTAAVLGKRVTPVAYAIWMIP